MAAPVLDQAGELDDGRDAADPADEQNRVAALRALGVLDQPRQPDLEAAARLAAYVCGTSSAAVYLVDADRAWPAAAHGFEAAELPRAVAPCAQVVTGTETVHLADARTDERFAASPLVSGEGAPVRRYASAPLLTREGYPVGTVCAFDDRPGHLTDEQAGLLRDVADQVMALFESRRLAGALARASANDALTGLANRRRLEQAVTAAVARAERGLGTPSVAVVDLDLFQQVNVTLGQAAGDAVLRFVADRLVRTARTVDTVARLGADEFAVLLEHTGGPGAVAALGRLRRSLLEDRPADFPPVGASLGVATYRPGDSVASLLSRADSAMFADKAGRAG